MRRLAYRFSTFFAEQQPRAWRAIVRGLTHREDAREGTHLPAGLRPVAPASSAGTSLGSAAEDATTPVEEFDPPQESTRKRIRGLAFRSPLTRASLVDRSNCPALQSNATGLSVRWTSH